MEAGQFSKSRRLQDLLANLSAERITVLHMSAKLSSPILRQALLESGKILHKNEKKANEIRKYLRMCTLNKDGLVVAKNTDRSQPFQANKTWRVVIPREFAYSYTVILHRKFDHPQPNQMLKLFNRNFFMLDAAEIIKQVTNNCDYPCQAVKTVPKETVIQVRD